MVVIVFVRVSGQEWSLNAIFVTVYVESLVYFFVTPVNWLEKVPSPNSHLFVKFPVEIKVADEKTKLLLFTHCPGLLITKLVFGCGYTLTMLNAVSTQPLLP